MENNNFKKLLCYNIVNNYRCAYKNKCMFAHSHDEQNKEPRRQVIYNMIYLWNDLSEINIKTDKLLLDELIIFTKECKNCINKKCPGGYNCKFGVCLKENKICFNDLMYGKCHNILIEKNNNNNILYKCINGIHLTEKNLIPYNQRILSDFINTDMNSYNRYNFNYKNNIISILLNDDNIKLAKDIIYNNINKYNYMRNDTTVNINNKSIFDKENNKIDEINI